MLSPAKQQQLFEKQARGAPVKSVLLYIEVKKEKKATGVGDKQAAVP